MPHPEMGTSAAVASAMEALADHVATAGSITAISFARTLSERDWAAVQIALKRKIAGHSGSSTAPSVGGVMKRRLINCRRCALRDDYDGHTGRYCSSALCRHCGKSYAAIIDEATQRRHGPANFCRTKYGANLERRFAQPTFQRKKLADVNVDDGAGSGSGSGSGAAGAASSSGASPSSESSSDTSE